MGLSDDFLDLTPKAKATKAKIGQPDYIQLKRFCIAKETINNMKRQPVEWEKICANHVSVKGLIYPKYTKNSHSSREKYSKQLD